MGGYAMVSLLVGLGIMSIVLSILLPVWNQSARRDREFELIFRGEQYARAVELYQRRFAGAYPPDFSTLIEQRLLRRMYRDPMTADGEFRLVYLSQVEEFIGESSTRDGLGESQEDETREPIQVGLINFDNRERGGVVGVVSQSVETALRVYNGRQKYNEWAFVYVPGSRRAGEGSSSSDPVAPEGRETDRSIFSDR
tara:strand:+ start:162 stop:752 length:591 start_codon:yes stop_codon:yes gene_type:complete